MVPFRSEQIRINGLELVAEAMLNNCAGVWTAVLRSEGRLVASGAGSTAEDAIRSATERARLTVGSGGAARLAT